MFNKVTAANYITDLCKRHNITVSGYSTTSSGRAKVKQRSIKIPKPTNVDRFAVCLHEIFHVIGKRPGAASFEQEFYCDKYALDTLIELRYDTEAWVKRVKWHVLSRIAMAHNRGLNHSKINAEIKEFFSDVDFRRWLGCKVFVGRPYYDNPIPDNIEIAQALNKNDVEMLLSRKGLMIEKSQYDDSTYGRWLVSANSDNSIHDFGSLHEIISHYQLSL